MVAPGGLVVFTVRPGAFIDDTSPNGEMALFTPEECAAARLAYDRGEIAYKPYPNSERWGVAITPMAYLRKLFPVDFEILRSQFFFQNWTQMPVFMRRCG